MSDGSRIFISYSHADPASVRVLHRLEQQLSFLARSGIAVWHDRRIAPGTNWQSEIKRAITEARAAILLVGPGLLSSEWVQENELPALRAAVAAKRLVLFPLLVTECAWDRTEIGQMQLVDPRPLDRIRTNAEKDKVLADLARQVAAALETVTPSEPEPVVLAVMGVKGGVGKGTFTSCIAHLFASAGNDVAIIDCDLPDAGTTREAMQRHARENVSVRTAYQHVAPYSQGFSNHPILPNEALWEITPATLVARNKGRIWLLPARTEREDTGGFDVVANIALPREPVLENVLNEMIARVRRQAPRVRFIVVDCGAGTNPLYSAAFAVADYGYILVLPDASYFSGIRAIKNEHHARYPQADLLHVSVVGNMVTSDSDRARLETLSPIAMIPRNPAMQEAQFESPVDFELGYDDVTAEVFNALQASFSSEHRALLPDAIAVHIRPWWNQLVEKGVARRALLDVRLRVTRWGAWTAAIVAAVMALATLGVMGLAALDQPVGDIENFSKYLTYLAVAFVALVASVAVLVPLERKVRILRRIAAFPVAATTADIQLLHAMLERRDRATMQYLHGLVKPARQGRT